MARAKFTPVPDLDELIATMAVDEVTAVARDVSNEAKRLAPALKEWNSMEDGRVRREHRKAEGQLRPMNLRFELDTHPWDREHRGLGESTFLLYPRDQSDPRVIVNLRNCRCWLVVDPDGIARMVHYRRAQVSGTSVKAMAYASGEWVVETEFGDVYDGGQVVEGSRFMGRAASSVAQRRNAGLPGGPRYVAGARYTAQMGNAESWVHRDRHNNRDRSFGSSGRR